MNIVILLYLFQIASMLLQMTNFQCMVMFETQCVAQRELFSLFRMNHCETHLKVISGVIAFKQLRKAIQLW